MGCLPHSPVDRARVTFGGVENVCQSDERNGYGGSRRHATRLAPFHQPIEILLCSRLEGFFSPRNWRRIDAEFFSSLIVDPAARARAGTGLSHPEQCVSKQLLDYPILPHQAKELSTLGLIQRRRLPLCSACLSCRTLDVAG